MDVLAILVLVILEPEVTMVRGMLMLRLTPSTWLPPTLDTPDTLAMALDILVTLTPLPMDMEILAMLDLAMEVLAILVFWEPEVTMARGMLMLRLTPNTLLVTPTLVMVLDILVIPTLVPMDMATWLVMAMLVLAMLVLVVLDLAMDIPTLPRLEPAETTLELLSPAKYELYLTFMIPCLLPSVFNKKSIILQK